jgi:hypothetical protein
MHRYIPVQAKWNGFTKIGEEVVQHQSRKYGVTKFGLERFLYRIPQFTFRFPSFRPSENDRCTYLVAWEIYLFLGFSHNHLAHWRKIIPNCQQPKISKCHG